MPRIMVFLLFLQFQATQNKSIGWYCLLKNGRMCECNYWSLLPLVLPPTKNINLINSIIYFYFWICGFFFFLGGGVILELCNVWKILVFYWRRAWKENITNLHCSLQFLYIRLLGTEGKNIHGTCCTSHNQASRNTVVACE